MLSVDIAINPTLGDLTQANTIRQWGEHTIQTGMEYWGGAPVNHGVRPDGWMGVPPLRTHEWFWGVPWTTDRQAQQLKVGNTL
eukprot:2725165-Pyramimonas_sp.AAC.1